MHLLFHLEVRVSTKAPSLALTANSKSRSATSAQAAADRLVAVPDTSHHGYRLPALCVMAAIRSAQDGSRASVRAANSAQVVGA